MKFEDRPAIPWAELQFADAEVQRAARQFHEFAESLVTKPEQAQRYKDVTSSNMPNYMGEWTIPEQNRRLSLSLHGQTLDGADRFHYFVAASQARVGIWSAEWSIHVWPKTSQYKSSVSICLRPHNPPNQPTRDNLEPFIPSSPGVSVDLDDGSLCYRYSVGLPSSPDLDQEKRLLYGTPEEFLDLASQDLEALRKKAKQEQQELLSLTVYDLRQTASDRPPRPMPVSEKLKPELRAKLYVAVDARLDADLAVLKTHYRDMHKAIQLALPRELYDSIDLSKK